MNKAIVVLASLFVLALSLPLQACQSASANYFEVLVLNITPEKVIVHEKFIVTAEISNASKSEANYVVPVMVNGIADERKSILLPPGQSQQVQFTLARSNAGTYEISVGNKSSSVTVEESLPAVIKLSDLKLNMEQAITGEEVVVTAIVSNTGGSLGTYVAELKINDTVEQAEKVILPPGVKYNLAFRVVKNDPAIYKVAIDDLTTQFTVPEPIQTIQLMESSDTPYVRKSQRSSSCCPGGGTAGGACP